jgi:hypothetical protein
MNIVFVKMAGRAKREYHQPGKEWAYVVIIEVAGPNVQ